MSFVGSALQRAIAHDTRTFYKDAKEWAAEETGIKEDLFPAECPYTVEQLTDKNWLPE